MICSKNKKKLNSPTFLTDEGKTITNPKNIAGLFNRFFTEVGTNIQNKISSTRKYYADYLLNPNKQTFLITPTTDEEISNIISDLKKLGKVQGLALYQQKNEANQRCNFSTFSKIS